MQKITYIDILYFKKYLLNIENYLNDNSAEYKIPKKKVNQPHDKTIKISLKKVEELLKKLEEEEDLNMRWMEILADGFDKKYEEGINQGISQGIREGIKEGIKEGIISTAKKMLKRNMEIKDIQEITGLAKEEIEKLAKSEL